MQQQKKQQKLNLTKRYRLNDGIRFRQEHFGMLFYIMKYPRLIFLSTNIYLGNDFFDGKQTLEEKIQNCILFPENHRYNINISHVNNSLMSIFSKLISKGILVEHN
ncbi:MAG: hypothetical protein HQK49_09280 [Oligoflexia bacterium]|nr:hypothetical protein [Oligoflexia bacterium]